MLLPLGDVKGTRSASSAAQKAVWGGAATQAARPRGTTVPMDRRHAASSAELIARSLACLRFSLRSPAFVCGGTPRSGLLWPKPQRRAEVTFGAKRMSRRGCAGGGRGVVFGQGWWGCSGAEYERGRCRGPGAWASGGGPPGRARAVPYRAGGGLSRDRRRENDWNPSGRPWSAAEDRRRCGPWPSSAVPAAPRVPRRTHGVARTRPRRRGRPCRGL